jgi:hypothetical protein
MNGKNNTNYYTGLDPLVRVRVAQGKRRSAVVAAMKARGRTVGEHLPLPDGYNYDACYDTIITPEAERHGYGLTKDGTLCVPNSQGSVESHWLRDLSPVEMLATVDAVEAQCAVIVQTLESYVVQCDAVSTDRLAGAHGQLIALTDANSCAAKLRALADELEKRN